MRTMRTGQAIQWTSDVLNGVQILRSSIHQVGEIAQVGRYRADRVHAELLREIRNGESGGHPGFVPKERIPRAAAEKLRIRLGIRKAEKGETPLSAEEMIYIEYLTNEGQMNG